MKSFVQCRHCYNTLVTLNLIAQANTDKLFLSYVGPHKPISKNSLARWIATVIRDAYSQLANAPSVNAHEVRAIASSMFVGPKNNHDDILAAGLWNDKWSYLGYYKRLIPTEWTSLSLVHWLW